MKNMWLTTTYLLLLSNAFAQNTRFITSGVIEYSKTVNMYAIITKTFDKNSGVYAQNPIERYKRTQPQFLTLKSTLSFSKDKALFTPIAGPVIAFTNIETPIVDQRNIIYSDLSVKSSISQKTVFEKTFLVKDSIPKINWKITDETREIAGYTCRRANAIILDSIYAVAFYTDKIHVSGGPESFTGLPGMILQLAIPHENITWVATSVTDKIISSDEIKAPVKGELINKNQLRDFIQSALKNGGEKAKFYWKAFLL